MKNAIFAAITLAALVGCVDQEELQAEVDNVLSRPLVPGAPGCEMRSPNGELINHQFEDVDSYQDSKVLIEAGTTVNGDCFPDANTTKS